MVQILEKAKRVRRVRRGVYYVQEITAQRSLEIYRARAVVLFEKGVGRQDEKTVGQFLGEDFNFNSLRVGNGQTHENT